MSVAQAERTLMAERAKLHVELDRMIDNPYSYPIASDLNAYWQAKMVFEEEQRKEAEHNAMLARLEKALTEFVNNKTKVGM